MRETFVLNALSRSGPVSTPVKGNFLMDNTYTIKVGGINQSFHQLSGMPNPIRIKEVSPRAQAKFCPCGRRVF